MIIKSQRVVVLGSDAWSVPEIHLETVALPVET